MDLTRSKKLNEEMRNLSHEIKEFPKGSFAEWFGKDLTGQTYDGNLDCSEEGLTSLYGCPKIVKGTFACSKNKLTSLEGAPEVYKDYFWCDDYLKEEARQRGYRLGKQQKGYRR